MSHRTLSACLLYACELAEIEKIPLLPEGATNAFHLSAAESLFFFSDDSLLLGESLSTSSPPSQNKKLLLLRWLLYKAQRIQGKRNILMRVLSNVNS